MAVVQLMYLIPADKHNATSKLHSSSAVLSRIVVYRTKQDVKSV
jgi:hypothetical protein